MKASKKLVTVVSVVLVTSLLFGTVLAGFPARNPLSDLWDAIFGIQDDLGDLQTQVDEFEVEAGATRTIIEGSFDITQDGDIIYEYQLPFSESLQWHHWKRIDMSQLILSDMPSMQIFVKPFTNPEDLPPSLEDTWVKAEETILRYDEGRMYIHYKFVRSYDEADPVRYDITGDYKIVVVK